MKDNKGFTFIELLITLTVFAIAFVPLMNMFTTSLDQSVVTSDLTTARYLAQEGMEKMKNLNFTETQLKEIGSIWEPAMDKPALDIDGQKWRTFRKVDLLSDPLEISIQVFKDIDLSKKQAQAKPLIEVVTLYEDYEWSFGQ